MIVTFLRLVIGCDEPWAVAAPEVAVAVDRPVARDPRTGQLHVPSTSLVGSLRAHLRRHEADEGLLGSRATFGAGDDVDNDRSGEGALGPSTLRVLGTVVDTHDRPTYVRTTTAIDRSTGAAATHTLRDSEVAPAGSIVTLYARADRLLTEGELAAIASWRPQVGGSRSAGLGRAHLVEVRWGSLDLENPDDLAQYLLTGGPELVETVVAQQHVELATTSAAPLLDLELDIVEGLLSTGATDGSRTKAHRRGGEGPAVLEGTQLKGVFRSRCEFILRSVGLEVCDSVSGTCTTCPTCLLFGSTERRGALVFRAAAIEQDRIEWRDHVGIDRLTGGARSHLLFGEEIATEGRLRLVVETPPGVEAPAWAEPLLLWIIRDLHDGMIGLGGRTSRGLGTVRVTDPSVVERLVALPPVTSLFDTTTVSS